MLTVQFDIVGISPYSQSRPLRSLPNPGEKGDQHDTRCWRERMYVEDGMVYVPPTAIKICLAEYAQYRSEKVPGKGQSTYTKHFMAGVLCVEPVPISVKADGVEGERLYLNADGKRGGGKRVWRTMPHIPSGWRGSVTLHLVDPVLIEDPDKVLEYLEGMGTLIGIGRFRPRNGGFYGRFKIENFKVVK